MNIILAIRILQLGRTERPVANTLVLVDNQVTAVAKVAGGAGEKHQHFSSLASTIGVDRMGKSAYRIQQSFLQGKDY